MVRKEWRERERRRWGRGSRNDNKNDGGGSGWSGCGKRREGELVLKKWKNGKIKPKGEVLKKRKMDLIGMGSVWRVTIRQYKERSRPPYQKINPKSKIPKIKK